MKECSSTQPELSGFKKKKKKVEETRLRKAEPEGQKEDIPVPSLCLSLAAFQLFQNLGASNARGRLMYAID